MTDPRQRAKEAECAAADDRLVQSERAPRYALQTPSGNIVGMGREKPKLSKQDRRDFWRSMRIR